MMFYQKKSLSVMRLSMAGEYDCWSITMGIGILLYIHDCLKPDPAVKTAARVTTHESHLINRAGILMNMGYGTPSISETTSQMLGNQDRRSFHSGKDLDHEQKHHESLSVLGGIQEEYIDQGSCLGNQGWSPFVDEETKTLGRKGITVLSDLF